MKPMQTIDRNWVIRKGLLIGVPFGVISVLMLADHNPFALWVCGFATAMLSLALSAFLVGKKRSIS